MGFLGGRPMKALLVASCALLVASCASMPDAPRDTRFFRDAKFAPPAERIRVADVFAVSPAMQRYVDEEIAPRQKARGRQLALIDALYTNGELKLEYDSAMTRNAAQAFDARSGNCLSLVIMTAAFAKALDLPVEYQKVFVDDAWARSGDIYLAIGHVNLTLGHRKTDEGAYASRLGRRAPESDGMTIDFLPPEDMRSVQTRPLSEETVVGMYMNNRAVESLARGKTDDAYWWAREAILQAPGFAIAYNTLAVVYRKHGDLEDSESVLRFALSREPSNTQVMGNLVTVLAESGKLDESERLAEKLARLEPEPPFVYFNRGMAALRAGDLHAAKSSFEHELRRDPDYHEFHFWLAVTLMGLGDTRAAKEHLAIALRNSTTRNDHDIYAAKLDRLNGVH
jgi:Tfp pilus assembly protein PilF